MAAEDCLDMKANRRVAGKKCAICQAEIMLGEDVCICGACKLPFHKACWAENWGCGTYGCQNAPSIAKASAADIRIAPEEVSLQGGHGSQQPPAAPQADEAGKTRKRNQGYRNYEEVPSYRRSRVNIMMLIVGLLLCCPHSARVWCGLPIVWLCIVCLTGDIYWKTRGKDGYLRTWSWGDKVLAVAGLLVFWVLVWLMLCGAP